MAQGAIVDEIPTDEEVLAAVGLEAEGKSPSEVLSILLAGNHTRANAQRAIQRVLDRGKIKYNTALRLAVVVENEKLAA